MVPPIAPRAAKPAGQEHKSWKKINAERKVLNRERRQDRLIKQMENAEKMKDLAKANEEAAVVQALKRDPSTISIAVPGSILENAQSPALRSYLAGQIARAASIFRVNEIIVFDDIGIATARDTKVVYETTTTETNGENGDETTTTTTAIPQTARKSCLQLARILQYLECPQYLRKFFFPLHKDLMYSGLLNPLDTPHHLRQQSMFLYREGIVTERQAKEGRCFVNVGLQNEVLVDKAITPGVRVTVKITTLNESKKLRGIVVSPDEPRRETGVYWGYTVRIAHSLAEVFTKSPYSGGYDRTIGTSDHGSNVGEVPPSSCAYNHLLIVFGGLEGLETALSNDEKLSADDPALLFDHYLNVLPKQGSRTIRTEEAVLIAMTALQEKLAPQNPDIDDSEYKDLLPRSGEDIDTINRNAKMYVEEKIENPFNNPIQSKSLALASNSSSADSSTEQDSRTLLLQNNGEEVKANPFTTKVSKFERERKRKYVENGESRNGEKPFSRSKFDRGTTTTTTTTTKRFEKSTNKERKPKERQARTNVVAEHDNDFEVVAANTVPIAAQPTKQKQPKKDLDLSRFD